MTIRGRGPRVRYAVVGLGHIAQVAVLPSFQHAENSELTALVSGDAEKLRELGKKYRIKNLYSYDEYDRCLENGEIDAVYIALPNHMHRDYSVRAAKKKIHVLCEKPMALDEKECREMIDAAERGGVKLMIAYRLHFEETNLKALEIVRSGRIGTPRIFVSTFTMQVREGDTRLRGNAGGGTLYDIGIYCINAARNLFSSEPAEVFAYAASNGEKRFQDAEEMVNCVMRFPDDSHTSVRLASFTTSFGAADVSTYRVVGTEGDIRLDPAYEYAQGLEYQLTLKGETETQKFSKRDQFAAELVYFSDCVANDRDPEPDGLEGLADVRVINALYQSIKTARPVKLEAFEKKRRPSPEQEIKRRPVRKPPETIHAPSPHP